MGNKHLSAELLPQSEFFKVEPQTTSSTSPKTAHPKLSTQHKEQQNSPIIETGYRLWDWNLQTNTVYYSPSWKAMLGYQESEIGDSPIEWSHRIHPNDVEKVRAELIAHLSGHTPQFKNEHRLLHKDGTYRWIRSQARVVRDSKGELYHLVGFQTEITAYRQAVAVLPESEIQFRAIAEALPLPVIIASAPHGLILYVNQSYAKAPFNSFLALSAEELIGRKAADFLHNPADQQVLQNLFAQDGYVRHYELPVKRVDGMPIWIDLSLQPLTNNDQTLFLACFFESAKHKQIGAKLHQVMGLLSLVQEFTTKDKQNEELQTTSRPSLTKVFRFIESNYRNPISLREVAQAVGYSSAYLTNLVQQETGRTVLQWITEYRMAEARLLLLKTNQSVNHIAVAVGYQGTEHFIRQFRKLHNTTPNAWRNEHRS
jgi:PAS domain S-box-containing protein